MEKEEKDPVDYKISRIRALIDVKL